MGKHAYNPKTNEKCPVNYYGGYVCSRECDFSTSLELEQSMPGHTYKDKNISLEAKIHFENNWN